MSTDVELWFRTKTEDLTVDSRVKGTLLEMRSVLQSIDESAIIAVARSNTLTVVFDCLNTSEPEQIELSSNIIYLLLKHLHGLETLSSYGNLLQRALSHPLAPVKTTILKLLVEKLDDEVIANLTTQSSLLEQMVECLACPDRGIAQGAVNFLKKLGTSREGLNLLFSNFMLQNLANVMKVDDVTRFRVYEIIIAVSVLSVHGLQASCASQLLPSLITEVKSTDSLIQLNVLELLNSLSSVDHGLAYLQEAGVIPYLVDKVLKIEEEPLSFILLPGLIEFFGNIYKLKPKQFYEHYPQILKVLFNSIDTPDPVLFGVIITTVGKIASTNEGKEILMRHQQDMTRFLRKVSQVLPNNNEISVTIMNVLGVLVKVDNNNETLLRGAQEWFEELGSDSLSVIVNIAKLPFVELRIAALRLILSLSGETWGLVKVCSFPGMTEFLIDRNSEFDKDCKLAKYDIVQTLVKSQNLSTWLSTEIIMKLKEFVHEGPFYVPVQPEVAFEAT